MLLTSDGIGYGEEEKVATICLEHNSQDYTSAILFAIKVIEDEETIAVLSAHDLRMWAAVFMEMAKTCQKHEDKRRSNERL